MRKVILMVLLAVVSSSAMAEWVQITVGHETLIVYADPASLRRASNKVKMWVLIDFKMSQTVDGKPYVSLKRQDEFNCKDEQSRTLFTSAYSRNMGGGDVIYSESISYKWSPVMPGSVGEGLWKFACGKR